MKRATGDDSTEQKNNFHGFLPNPEAEFRILTSKPSAVTLQQGPAQHLGSDDPFVFLFCPLQTNRCIINYHVEDICVV